MAVSGGADSLALAFLADAWARARGGSVTALTVDHGLRADSAAEAARVAGWLGERGVAHRTLNWTGAKPQTGVQARARAARYELLASWCRTHGVLHLLLGHQRNDQAETLLLREQRGSGSLGLAAMASKVEGQDIRLLRPLLGVPHARAIATLQAIDQSWIEDPSNRDPRFGRTAMRRLLSGKDGDVIALADAARRWGYARESREMETADLLARAVTIYPQGWARIDQAAFGAAPDEVSRATLARALMTIGGGAYPPRGERLDRLHATIRRGLHGGRTLAGCCLRPWRGALLLVREAAAAVEEMIVAGPGRVWWDRRFALSINGTAVPGGRIACLGEGGWATIAAKMRALRCSMVPAAARAALPALWDLDGVLQVPHLMYRRQDADPVSVAVESATFRPCQPLAGPGFATA
ncbi:MAG: tRNA lysidine(34) synthetase TilS [Proteobacteria bacterium]|nr:tRNA lysidine(34) synthetase TilS [Pseudomonadota bacterium]